MNKKVGKEFRIDPCVFELFPELVIGAAFLSDIPPQKNWSHITDLLHKEQQRIRLRFRDGKPPDLPAITTWRDAYAAFGAKPKKHTSSVESLYRMTLEGIDLKPVSPVVDLYNLLSLHHMIPMGADDLDYVEGSLRLTRAEGTEIFLPLNSSQITHPKKGEIIYRDDRDVLCRRWNWREADKTKLTTNSRRILLVGEGLPPVQREKMEAMMDDLREKTGRFLKSRIRMFLLHRDFPAVPLNE